MLTFTNTPAINFIALTVAEETNDNNEVYGRLYNNDVELFYTINDTEKLVHILYIESYNKRCGNATKVINSFLNEFEPYTITIEALYYLENWYTTFGFVSEYSIDDMLSFKMNLFR